MVRQCDNGGGYQNKFTGNIPVCYADEPGLWRVLFSPVSPSPTYTVGPLTVINRQLALTPSSGTNFVPGISSLTLTPATYSYTNGTWYRVGRIEYATSGTVGTFTVKKGGVHKLVATDAVCGVQEATYLVNYECDQSILNSSYAFDITTLNGTATISSSPAGPFNTHMVVDGDITITNNGTNVNWSKWNGLNYDPITVCVKSGASIVVENQAYLFMDNVTLYSCDYWDGIRVDDDGGLDFFASNMNNAEVGIFSKNNSTVRVFGPNEFEDNGMHMAVLDCDSPNTIWGGHLKSLVSTTQNNSDYATLLASGDMLTSPMVFIQNSEYCHMLEVNFDQRDDNDADAIVYSGIEMSDVQNTNFEYCHFMDNLAYGAYLRDCSNMMIKKNRAGSHIVNVSTPQYNPAVPYTNTGMKMDQCFDIFMERSTIESCDTGLMFFQNLDTTGASISILDSVSFQDCPFGIILAPEMNPWLNADNTVNDQAAAGYEINLRLDCNQFFGAEYAVSGSGILLNQGTASVGASNNFNTTDNPNLEWGVYWRSSNGGSAFTYNYKHANYNPTLGNNSNPNLDGQSVSAWPPEYNDNYIGTIGTSDKCAPAWSIYKRNPLGINPDSDNLLVTISPNPFQNQLTLTIEGNLSYTYRVYNAIGMLISQGFVLGDNNKVINTSDWKPGLYILNISEDNSIRNYQKKVIKY
jgi:hypothetical protein